MVVKLEKEIHLNRLLQVLSSANTYTRNTKLMLKQTHSHVMPTWYGDLLRYRNGGAMLLSDSDSVGPSNKGYLRTTTDGSGQVGNREGLLSCLTSADRRW